MPDSKRTPSARSNGGSRRRRWEVKSKEAFETSLAIEIESPENRAHHTKKECRKEPSTETSRDKNNYYNSYGKYPKASSPEASEKTREGKDCDGTDILSSRISALIDEASAKVKDPQRKSSKDKQQKSESKAEEENEREHRLKGTHEKRPVKDSATEAYPIENLQIIPLRKNDKAQIINDKFETKSLKVAASPEGKGGYEEENYVASAPPLPSDEQTTPKNKKHKKEYESKQLMITDTNEESYISLQLKEMSDDIIEVTREDKDGILSAPKLLLAASASHPSSNISTIYQERLSGFVVTRNEFAGVHRKNEDLLDVNQVPSRTSHAVFLQGGFRTFSVLCQGLLAGITLAHCLLIFLLESDPSKIPGLYPPSMTHVFFALIIFLSTICLVSACDRSDLIGNGVFSGHGIKVPWTTAFYISSLVLSLAAIRTENVLINYNSYRSSSFTEKEIKELVEWWRWVCVARSSLALLAWLAMVPDPHTDALLDMIQELHRS
ncbi:uncharacterized protein [Procambarus clarkii]|uniref:uncharacterized protein n=1 Tax=Procambarus clarkii TaxID=6728 RepID=UPI0037435DDC